MIPYAILQAELYMDAQTKVDVRVLDLAPDAFTFRLLPDRDLRGAHKWTLSFWSYERASFERVELDGLVAEAEEETEFYVSYQIEVQDVCFEEAARRLMREYMAYVDLKLAGDDAAMSQSMCGYPARIEEVYAKSCQDWVEKRIDAVREKLAAVDVREAWRLMLSDAHLQLSIEVESSEMIQALLSQDWSNFMADYWQKQGLAFHPIAQMPISYLYIGRGFCLKRMPPVSIIKKLFDKAEQNGLCPVLVLPPLREREGKTFEDLLTFAEDRAREKGILYEVVVNDWGSLERIRLINQNGMRIRPVAGVLLNKRRKDSRLRWKLGREEQLHFLMENDSNSAFYQERMQESYGLDSFAYESCNYEYDTAPGHHLIYFPFYQMNTAGHCTLYAVCQHGDRSRQGEEKDCTGYCRNHAFLYPDGLNLIGYQNTIFAYDDRVLIDVDYYEGLCDHGRHRMVLREVFR